MSRAYEFAIKLRDLFTPQMMRLADQYERRTSWMGRLWDRFTGMLRSSSQTVDALRRKLTGLNAKVRVDSTELDRARDKAGRLRDELGRFVAGGGVKGALLGGMIGGGVAGMAMGGFDLIRDQIGMIQDKTVGAAQRKEGTMFRLNELMGKDVASSLVKNIVDYMPSKRDALIESATKLSGAGVASDKMMDTLKALNNISAITGASVEEMSMIQAKIKATGYVQGDEINMFKERGINLNPYIAQVMGVREDQIAKLQSQGKISYDIFDKAMQAYAGKGGRYDGAAERAQGLTGERDKALSAKWDSILENLGNKLLPFKNRVLDILTETLNGTGPIATAFEKVWNAIKPIFEGMGRLLQGLGLLTEQGSISQGVFTTLGETFAYLGHVMNTVLWVLNIVSEVIGYLIGNPIVQLIAGLYGAAKAWMFLNAVIAANPIMAAITAILAFVAGVQYAWDTFDGFREGVLRSWEMIKSAFSNIGQFLYKLFTLDFGGALAVLGKTISGGRAAGDRAVAADRQQRAAESKASKILASATTPQAPGSPTSPTGGGLAGAAGLSSSVGNAKSNNVTINIASLIAKSEITVMDLQEGIDDIESKLIDALLRVANSGSRAVLS